MRSRRLLFIFTAFYFVFLGGSAYYTFVLPVHIFHHAFVTVLLAVWLFRRFRNGAGLPRTALDLPIYAAVVVWAVTALAGIDRRMAFEGLWFVLLHLVIFYILVDLFQRGRSKLVMEAQFILGAVVVFITSLELLSWYFGLGLTGAPIGWIQVIGPGAWLPLEPLRVSLAMNISTLLAGYTAPLIMLAAGWAMTVRRRDYRQALWGLAITLTVVLLLTFSRGGLLSLLAAAGSLTAMRMSRMTAVTTRISPRLVLGGAVVVGIVVTAAFMIVTVSGTRSSGDQVRLDMYESAVEIATDNPALGIGPGLYGRAYRDYREIPRDKLASAHNAYLNTAAETGLAGIAVSIWLGIALLRGWWKTWLSTAPGARRLRLEAVFAALIGVAVHSMVDAFTTTPLVILIVGMIAYSITGPRGVLDPRPPGRRWPAAVLLVIVLAYGAAWIQWDRAFINYQFSIIEANDIEAIEIARTAADIDPALNLYDLQIAYLTGEAARANGPASSADAIAAYERALELEPTWDTGWLNLAALIEREGDPVQAFAYVQNAYQINPSTSAALHLARLGEATGLLASGDIVSLYQSAIHLSISMADRLPLSAFWTATVLRRTALETYSEQLPLDLQYRIWAVHDPERAESLVPDNPTSAAEYWVAGEYALTIDGDSETAVRLFSEAIERDRRRGDYYVSRARARLDSDRDETLRDLNIARLLGTRDEYPDAVEAMLVDDEESRRDLLASALPPRVVNQEFAAVLYGGRIAVFDLFPEMRYPGPGTAVMQPWYLLGQAYVEDGLIDDARGVYESILDYAPDETEAQARWAVLPR